MHIRRFFCVWNSTISNKETINSNGILKNIKIIQLKNIFFEFHFQFLFFTRAKFVLAFIVSINPNLLNLFVILEKSKWLDTYSLICYEQELECNWLKKIHFKVLLLTKWRRPESQMHLGEMNGERAFTDM